MRAPRWPLLACLLLGALLWGPRAEAGPTPKPGDPGVPDKELQKAIDAAVEKGAAWLRAQQKSNGLLGGGVQHAKGRFYTIGTTALAGLALLAAGDKQGDPVVDKAMEYCRKLDQTQGAGGGRTTYDTGTLLMFAVEYYRVPETEGANKKKHSMTKKEAGDPCHLPPDVLPWIKDMAMFLVNSQEGTGDWGYPKPRPDNSNTQYALLGLRAARDCGGIVPGKVFLRVIERLLASQEQDGPKVLRTLGGEKKGERTYVIDAGDRARGWSYLDSPYQATGSMTTSGISSLAICHDALTHPELPIYTSQMNRKVRTAIQDGFAWLDVHFAVDHNPPNNAAAWHYYYLYGLERAAALAGRTLIGKHDWYIEGARYLVAKQKPGDVPQGGGRWSTGALPEYEPSDALDTAWAILFLKKATRPAEPIPGPVVTPASGK